jgi:hypothetical protein
MPQTAAVTVARGALSAQVVNPPLRLLIARTAVRAAMGGDAVWAKLLLAYTEGLPTQPLELDITTEVERAAARYGVDPAKVISIYERLKKTS